MTEIVRFVVSILSIVGLIFEFLQIITKRRHYFKLIENWIDLILFTSTLVICLTTLGIRYDKYIHCAGCLLIVIAGLRVAWMFTHVHFLGIGHRFRMLFSVLRKVSAFGPLLVFFIVLFSVVFHILFENQEPFSHLGFSIMKIMAMTIGELDFTSTFFDESNVDIFETLAFLIFVLFLVVMSVSMINLLIGIAIPDVEVLSKQGKQEDFKSMVDLILQYSYMLPRITNKIHGMQLAEIFKWGKLQDLSVFEHHPHQNDIKLKKFKKNNAPIMDKFKMYVANIEQEYNQYKV